MSTLYPPCLACGADGVRLALDLGVAPPANLLLTDPGAPCRKYPLSLTYCSHCGHGQQAHFAPAEDLFSQYLYASGTSATLRSYFLWFRDQITQAYGSGRRVLEIACNDGSLLELFAKAGHMTLGVDPAANLVKTAREKGLDVVEAFWPCPGQLEGQFDVIIAMNVLAHTPDAFAFLQGLGEILASDGVAFIQTSQALMLENGEFDTIYHEHYSFFTERSFASLARRAGLQLRTTRLVDIHGVSSVFIVTHVGAPPPPAHLLAEGEFAVTFEGPVGESFARITGEAHQYNRFSQLAASRMKDVESLIKQARDDGRVIGFVGAAAKSLTFIHASRIVPDHLYDEAPLKIGLAPPGLGRTIEPLEAISQVREPMLIVLSAWNFAAELARKTRERRPSHDDLFMVYFPSISVFG